MGQPQVSKQAENAQIQTQQAQTQIAQDAQAQSKEDRDRRVELEQPAIDKAKALATGDRTEALKASMPVLSKVSEGYQASKQSILNNLPPGPSRDKAIADLEIQKFTTTSGAQAAAVEGAPSILANIGAGLGATSLQELGAALSGYSGAASTASDVKGGADARKAQNLQLLGGLAGTAGSAAVGLRKPSDRSIKRDIFKEEDVLDRIDGIDAYSYEYVAPRYDPKRLRHIGVIAQEVRVQFPEAVTLEDEGTSHQHYEVDYGAIAAIALAAVRELAEKVKRLEEKLNRGA